MIVFISTAVCLMRTIIVWGDGMEREKLGTARPSALYAFRAFLALLVRQVRALGLGLDLALGCNARPCLGGSGGGGDAPHTVWHVTRAAGSSCSWGSRKFEACSPLRASGCLETSKEAALCPGEVDFWVWSVLGGALDMNLHPTHDISIPIAVSDMVNLGEKCSQKE